MKEHNTGFESLIRFSEIPQGNIDAEQSRIMYARALTELERFDLPERIGDEISRIMGELLDSHLGVQKTLSPDFDSGKAYRESKPGLESYLSRRRSAASQLRSMVSELKVRRYKPSGFSAKSLREEAEIGRKLWQKLRKSAGISVKPGNSGKTFSNRDIKLLIDAARSHETPKSIHAAAKWAVLLQENHPLSD